MLVQEIHIQFDQIVQSTNSKVRRTVESEEIDWLFNEAAIDYVHERSKRKNPTKVSDKVDGFEDTSKRYEDVEQLITTVPLPLYRADLLPAPYNVYEDTYITAKPVDFLNYIPEDGFAVRGLDNCNFDFNSYNTTTDTHFVFYIDFPDSSELSAPFYNNFKIVLNGTVTIFDSATMPNFNGSISDKDLKFYLISVILETINSLGLVGVEAYWNLYNGKTYNNKLIIVSKVTLYNACDITYGSFSNTYFSVVETYDRFSTGQLTFELNPCRVVKSTERLSLLNHSFGSTRKNSPLVTLERNLILVHHKKRFISNELLLTYIRLPRKINLSLGIDSDLSDDVCYEIINLATRKFLARVNARTYNNIMNENLLLTK